MNATEIVTRSVMRDARAPGGAAAVPSLMNTTTATPIHPTVVECDRKQLVR
jgi:hypothetical protein